MSEEPPAPSPSSDPTPPNNGNPKPRPRTNWRRLIILLTIWLCLLVALIPERPKSAVVAAENGVYVYRQLSDADEIVQAIENDLTLDVVASQLRKVKYDSIRENLAAIYGTAAMDRAHRPYVESGRAVLLPEGCLVKILSGYRTPSGTPMKKVEVTGGEYAGFEGYSSAHGDIFDTSKSLVNSDATRLLNLKAAQRGEERRRQESEYRRRQAEYEETQKQRARDAIIAEERSKVEAEIARERARAEELERAEQLRHQANQDEIASEEGEAARLYAMGWVGSGRDGRTIDEFMFLEEWKHPQQARAAMERAKAEEETNLRRHYANDPKRLSNLLSSFELAKTNRDRRMREEIEYQKQRTQNPERYPEPYKHFFGPEEVMAWRKAQEVKGSRAAPPAHSAAGDETARNQLVEDATPPAPRRAELTTESFLTQFIESGEKETPNEAVACYADTVDYYDQGLRTRDQIRQDTVEHFRKWPQRSYHLVGQPRIVRESATKDIVTCDVAFEVSDGKRRIEGVAENSITLDVGTMKIVGIREEVVKRRATSIDR